MATELHAVTTWASALASCIHANAGIGLDTEKMFGGPPRAVRPRAGVQRHRTRCRRTRRGTRPPSPRDFHFRQVEVTRRAFHRTTHSSSGRDANFLKASFPKPHPPILLVLLVVLDFFTGISRTRRNPQRSLVTHLKSTAAANSELPNRVRPGNIRANDEQSTFDPSAHSRRTFLKTSTLALGTAGLAAANSAEAASWFSPGRNLLTKNAVILFQGDSITDAGRSRDKNKAETPNNQPGLGNGYAWLAAAELLVGRSDDRLKFLNRGISGNRSFNSPNAGGPIAST